MVPVPVGVCVAVVAVGVAVVEGETEGEMDRDSLETEPVPVVHEGERLSVMVLDLGDPEQLRLLYKLVLCDKDPVGLGVHESADGVQLCEPVRLNEQVLTVSVAKVGDGGPENDAEGVAESDSDPDPGLPAKVCDCVPVLVVVCVPVPEPVGVMERDGLQVGLGLCVGDPRNDAVLVGVREGAVGERGGLGVSVRDAVVVGE